MMKILLATDTYIPVINGVVTSTVTLKESLKALGHDVRVLALGEYDFFDDDQDIYRLSSFNMERLYPGARVTLLAGRKVMNHIYDWQPDIIHTQCEFSTFRIARHIAEELNIPIVHTYHTVYEDYTHYFSPKKTWGKKFVSYLTKKVLGYTEAVIAPTSKVEHLLKNYGVQQPISVIPTGIHLDKFSVKLSETERFELRQRYHIPKDHFLLVTIGRIAQEKNLDELVDFLSKMDEANISLLIVGDGPHRESLEAHVAKSSVSDRVHFAGMIAPEDVPIYYQLGDAFVSASTSETQGLTYIEAMASGLPALCRHDESIQNVVISGVNGYQYHDFSDFEQVLSEWHASHELRLSLGESARKTAYDRYSAEAFGRSVLSLYEQAIATYADHYTKNLTKLFLP